MKLALVTNKNLIEAYNIQKTIFPSEPDYLLLKNAVDKKDRALKHFLAYNNGKCVGITGIYVEACDKDSIWLSWFGVLKEERSKGYGRKMLEATKDICKKLPFKYFRCYTSSKYNASAIPLYNSFFEITEKYENNQDETYQNTAMIYSSSLTNEKVKPWDNKYIGIKEYDELCVKGEEFLKTKSL